MEKIKLTKSEKRLIRLCKGKHIYKKTGSILDLMKKYYKTHYALDPDKYYLNCLSCMFEKLFEVYMKVRKDGSGHNVDLKSILYSSFSKGIVRNQELPVERAIAELYGQIQCTTVREKNSNGVYKWRFDMY